MPDESVGDVVLAVSEACANAIAHTPSSEVWVTCSPRPTALTVDIEDQGVFEHHWRENVTGGHGIPIMLVLTDELSVRAGREGAPGTRVRLVKYRPGILQEVAGTHGSAAAISAAQHSALPG